MSEQRADYEHTPEGPAAFPRPTFRPIPPHVGPWHLARRLEDTEGVRAEVVPYDPDGADGSPALLNVTGRNGEAFTLAYTGGVSVGVMALATRQALTSWPDAALGIIPRDYRLAPWPEELEGGLAD